MQQQQRFQSKIIILIIIHSFIIGSHVIEGKFEKYDMPKPIDPGEEDSSVSAFSINGGNDIESDRNQEDCPFSQNDDDNNKQDDWQMIDLPHHEDHHQFDHVDHLPLMKMIDYNSWPIKMLMISKKNEAAGYSSGKKQQQQHYDGGLRTKLKYPLIDARKLFLEKKFHYKSKLSAPVNYDHQHHQQQQQQEVKEFNDDSKKTVEYPTFHTNQMQQPIVTMFTNQKTIDQKLHEPDQHNELIQQQDLLVQAEKDHQITTDAAAVNTPADSPALEAKQLKTEVIEVNYANNNQSQNNQSRNKNGSDLVSSNDYQPQMNRARESFEAAAEFARQLEPTSSSSSREPESRTENSSISDSSNFTSSTRELDNSLNAVDWDVETTTSQPLNTTYNMNNVSSTNNSQLEDKGKFLGFGQIYKNDNARSTTQQARLSCSFGFSNELQQDGYEKNQKNVTISDVKWAKFVGNYDPDQVEPPFECKYRTCRVMEVKNDIWTTVHPRPAIQHYLGGQAQNMPSYSVTIHQVDPERHIGVYRCSAIRQIGDKNELVYRILPFL